MKILVTGCAGFIGANFCEYWLNSYPNDTVIGVDSLTYAANLSALEGLKLNDKFTFYKENICNSPAVDEIFEKEQPEVVINFAAESHVDRSIDSSRIFIESNVLGVQSLLDASLKYGVKRYHQISTDEVYGDLPLDSVERFSENSPLKPSSPYSASKAAADLLVLSYHKTHGLPVTISRSANNYGKYQHEEKLVPKVVAYAKANKPIPIYGTGLNVRNWLFVEDHARAIDLILKQGNIGEIYNVGDEIYLTNIQMVERILSYMDKPSDFVVYTEDRKGHDRKYALNCDKLRADTGWAPKADFKDALKSVVLWYKSK